MKDFWDARYSEEGLAYGDRVNEFLATQSSRLRPGMRVLVVGDGEGRNGVWLAQQGLDVTTVDYSAAGVARAEGLAAEHLVSITTHCADLNDWVWPLAQFDAVVSIYLHFPPEQRPIMHQRMLDALKPGGVIILEAFNKAQLNYTSGGPPVEEMLFSAAELEADFANAMIDYLAEQVVELNEGKYHVGRGAVVRLIAHR